ncbi:MAG: DUF2029 domain-containing protein [Chloroflexi bacterium]|nr:DUF2029 domain-containing protein [Chloroflexota bacterium]
MFQSGERAQTPRPAVRLAAHARSKFMLLHAEVLVGSPDLARLGLVALALALQTAVLFSPGHFRPAASGMVAILVALGTLGSLALALLASLDLKRCLVRPLRQALAAAALAVLAVLAVIGIQQGTNGVWAIAHGMNYTNDGAVMDLYAAHQVRFGHNPYVQTNIVRALANVDAPARTVTPLMDGQFRGLRAYPSDGAIEQALLNVLHYRDTQGVPVPSEFESKYNYPAGSFLVILPFVWMGVQDMRFLYTLAILAMAVYLWARMPRSLRLLVPLLLLANVPIIAHAAGGQPDPIYGLMLMIGYAEWRRRWTSPLAMGLATATKQLAWFFLPFYLLLVIRRFGWREAARRSGLIGLTFLLTNGPFILLSPGGYLASISAPMRDPMFPLGIGIIALFASNVLPLLPKVAFTLAELGSWLACVAASLRLRFLTPASGVVFAALPLFFAWRSLVNYFYLVPLLVLAVALAERSPAARSET